MSPQSEIRGADGKRGTLREPPPAGQEGVEILPVTRCATPSRVIRDQPQPRVPHPAQTPLRIHLSQFPLPWYRAPPFKRKETPSLQLDAGEMLAFRWEGKPMKAGLMKLTALSVVLGVGLLAVLQARKSTQTPPADVPSAAVAELGDSDPADTPDSGDSPAAGNTEPSFVDEAEELLDEVVTAQQKTAAPRPARRSLVSPPRRRSTGTESEPSTADDEFDRLLTETAEQIHQDRLDTPRSRSRARSEETEDAPLTQARAVTRVGVNSRTAISADESPADFESAEPADQIPADTSAPTLAENEEFDEFESGRRTPPNRREGEGLVSSRRPNRVSPGVVEADEDSDETSGVDEDGLSGRSSRARPQLRRVGPATTDAADEFSAELEESAGTPARGRLSMPTRGRLSHEEETNDGEESESATDGELIPRRAGPPLRGRPQLSTGATRERVVTVAADEEETDGLSTDPTSELEESEDSFAPRRPLANTGRLRTGTRFESEDDADAEPVPTPREVAPLNDDGPTGALADEDFPSQDDTAPSPSTGTVPSGEEQTPGDAAAAEASEEPAEMPTPPATPDEPDAEQPRPTLEEDEDPLPVTGGRPGGKSPATGVEELEDEDETPAPPRSPAAAGAAAGTASGSQSGPDSASPGSLAEDEEPLLNQRRNPAGGPVTSPNATPRGNGLATPDVAETPSVTGGGSRKPRPKLSIEKRAPDTAVLGRPMVYEIVVRNSGLIAAQGVTVEDVVPSGLQIEATKPQAQLEGRRLSWRLGSLEPGASETIAVRVIPMSEGTVGGVATVHFDNQREGAASTGPRLQVNVDAPRRATVGQTVTVSFKIRNLGPTLATGVLIHNVLPAGLKHPAGDDLEFEIGDLPPGSVREVSLQLQAAQAGTAVNRSIVTAEGAVSEETVTQFDLVGPALDVARTGSRRMNPGRKGRFVNTVTNPTTNPLTRVTLTETIPAGLEFVDAGDGGRYDESRRMVSWEIGPLGPRESRSVSLSLTTAGRGSQISVVRASDPSGASGETVGTLQVVGTPALSIEAPDLPGAIDLGQEAQATYRIYNRGTDAALNTRVVLSIPGNLEVIGVDGPVKYQTAAVGGARQRSELRLEPIRSIDVKKFAEIRLTLRGRTGGGGRVKVQAACDQAADPILREDDLQVVAE